MNTELMLDVSQAHELKLAFRRSGWTKEEIKRLSEGDTLRQVRDVLLCHAEIIYPDHVIDLDATPVIFVGSSVEEHQKGGIWKFDPTKVILHLEDDQKKSKCVKGDKLRKQLAGKSILNANVLDYLIAHQHLIPEEWKGKCVYFWGTIYRDGVGGLCVRYLGWDGDQWRWFCSWLDGDWHTFDPAALRA